MQQQTVGSDPKSSIGDIIASAHNLTSDEMERILAHQKQTGKRFGEAAVDLGLVKREDVLWALSQQFHYPYAVAGATASVNAELVAATNPFDNAAEFFRDVRSLLLGGVLAPDGAHRPALAVCSPERGDGKSFFVANLGVTFSQLGARTVIVDADMRTPRQHEIFGVEATGNGLSGMLSGRTEVNVVRPISALPSLYLLPVGVVPPNPSELLQQPNFDLLLVELLRKFDYVIVDTPAAIHGADARISAIKCGAALAIARKGTTKANGMSQLVQALKKSSVKFAGTILNEYR